LHNPANKQTNKVENITSLAEVINFANGAFASWAVTFNVAIARYWFWHRGSLRLLLGGRLGLVTSGLSATACFKPYIALNTKTAV